MEQKENESGNTQQLLKTNMFKLRVKHKDKVTGALNAK
jgi:hypothetical protein